MKLVKQINRGKREYFFYMVSWEPVKFVVKGCYWRLTMLTGPRRYEAMSGMGGS